MSVDTGNAVSTNEVISLWRTWFDAGNEALERRAYGVAIEWLCEALRHLCLGGSHDRLHAMTEGNLAFAYLLAAEQLEVCLKDPCTPAERQPRIRTQVDEYRKSARAHALSAVPRLASRDLPSRVAYGRAELVLGELQLESVQLGVATVHFQTARQQLQDIASQDTLLEQCHRRLFECAYRLGKFESALGYLNRLEEAQSQRPGQQHKLAWLLACKADVLLHLGKYRRADDLFQRWTVLQPKCNESRDCAYSLAVFGRARFLLGHFVDAHRLLSNSQATLRNLCVKDDLLAFDVALCRAELATRCGEYGCATTFFAEADGYLIELEMAHGSYLGERQVRLCVAKGRQQLSLGCFEFARSAFAKALQIAESKCECHYLQIVPCLLGLARVESERSCLPAAKQHVCRALKCLEEATATLTAEMAWTLHELAYVYVQDDKVDEAQPVCRKAIQMLTMSLRAQHPDESPMQVTLARSLSGQHRADQALAATNHAEEIIARDTPGDLFSVARVLRTQAEIYHARRNTSCAIWLLSCADRVWSEQERNAGVEHPEKALTTLSLAVAHVAYGETPLAAEILVTQRFFELIRQLKGTSEYAGYEISRVGDVYFAHKLFAEAEWLYALAAGQYELACGPSHPLTLAARANRQRAADRLRELVAPEDCPCVPWYQPCRKHGDLCRCHVACS